MKEPRAQRWNCDTQPEANVVGIDADSDVLHIARRKSEQAGLELNFQQGMVFALPYRDNCFDRVLLSLLLHHLVQKDKLRALRDTFRVLQHGGELHVADWGAPLNAMSKVGFLLVRMLDGFENTRDNAQGLLPELFRATRFRDVRKQDGIQLGSAILCYTQQDASH